MNLLIIISNYFKNVTFRDILDIAKYIVDIVIVSYVVYKTIILVRQTRAGQLVKGILILLIATQLSGWLGLNTFFFILSNTMTVGLIAVLIVFQPELRGALERIGRSRFGNIFNFEEHNYTEKMEMIINEIAEAVAELSKTSTGALIVIERDTKLGDIVKTGTILNANVSSELIKNIFFPYAPLHDGGILIGKGKIKAAGCILPLTDDYKLDKELGTRHRAALGIAEISDAVVVVVSEETGKISIAYEGRLTRNFTPETLRRALTKALFNNDTEGKAKIWKGKNIWKRVE